MSDQEKRAQDERELTDKNDEVIAHAETDDEDTPWCGVCSVN